MTRSIFRDGMPERLVDPMFNDGYSIQPGTVDPDFAADLLTELRENDQYNVGGALQGREAGVHHNPDILNHLGSMPLLREYLTGLNEVISEVSGYRRQHLTYLTTRVCPVEAMSTRIHRNDSIAGPWLVALTVAGSGSFNIYDDSVLAPGEEIRLHGDDRDPVPLASSPMQAGDAWGIYSLDWSAPHAGGPNTSIDPKVLVLLYGWNVRREYLDRAPGHGQHPQYLQFGHQCSIC